MTVGLISSNNNRWKLNTGLFFNSLLYTSYTYSSKHRRVMLQITAASCWFCGAAGIRQHRNIRRIINHPTAEQRYSRVQCTKCVFYFILHFLKTFPKFQTSPLRSQTCERCNFRVLPRRGLSFPHYRGIHVILQRQGLAKKLRMDPKQELPTTSQK